MGKKKKEAKRLKKHLLAHYAEKEPRFFYQFDAWPGGECYATPVHELMRGSTVRVLIPLGAKEDDVLDLLCSLRDWIVKDGLPPWKNSGPNDNLPF